MARRYGRRATPVDRTLRDAANTMRIKQAECNVRALAHYPFEESLVSVSRNFHNLCGRARGPDRFILVLLCTMSPSLVPFFHGALQALQSGGAKRGRMTVNQDALSVAVKEAMCFSQTSD